MKSKRQLLFVPSEEEEEYLENQGYLNSWTRTIRRWMELDKKRNRKQIFDKIQNGLILIVIGIMTFGLSYLIIPFSPASLMWIGLLCAVSAIAVTFGAFSIFWELLLNVKR